ncbi:hypothetical protein P43SY_010529 [Pythium insidiosum]|uniref:HTH myb-type domain-containing protein n=1 Tax=Pythium insidiosum TaxID=114742 RepID=A0AAD5LPN6_PYTIN|nr:hypothetical protein P43SY_010529 [Pythium insidiosum]
MFPTGPWTRIAQHVGTRTTRQTMTHAQKYRQRIARQERAMQRQIDRTGAVDRLATASHDFYANGTTLEPIHVGPNQYHAHNNTHVDDECFDVLAEMFANDNSTKDIGVGKDGDGDSDDFDFDFAFVDAMLNPADATVRLDSDMEALLSQLDQYDLDDISQELDQLLACSV